MSSPPMRVAVVTHYFPTSIDPSAGRSAYETLRLLARNCRLHVFVPEMDYPAAFTPPTRRLRGAADRSWRVPDVDATLVPYPIFPVVSRPLNGFAIGSRLLQPVRQFKPDIVLSYVVYSNGFAAVRIARALQVPVVLTAIGSDLNRIPDPICRRLTSSALRRADFIITVSHDLARTAQALGSPPARTRAVLNGCDTAVFHPMDRAQARTALALDPAAELVLYVGRLDLRKGLVELIDAVTRLRRSRPALRCYLVGDGPDDRVLDQAIRRNLAESFITIVPPCPMAEVARWISAADLVTLPSYNEGCPNVVLEALACGRPVVATRVGGIPELMDESVGRLVPLRDVPALALALGQVLDLPWDERVISARHGRSWQAVADELQSILEHTLADHTRRSAGKVS